jgi:uroporphyrinogen decarboxylase
MKAAMSNVYSPFDRVWKTLNHEEPDRVPIYEGSIEPPSLTQGQPELYFQPGLLYFSTDLMKIATLNFTRPIRNLIFQSLNKRYLLNAFRPIVQPGLMMASKLHRKFGIDLMGFSGGLPMILNPKVLDDFKVKHGNTIMSPHDDIVTKISDNYGAVSRFGFLRSPADYEKYIQFDADSPANYFMVKPGLKAAEGKLALYFSVFGAAFFELLSDMFGFTTLFKLLVKEPQFIKRVVKDISDFACANVEHLSEEGAKLFYMSNDLGQNNRLMISPMMYKKYFMEGEKKFCQTVHKHGGKVLMHSCGNTIELIDTLIDVGIDALHPWQPYAGMDIFDGKKRWGKKITLVGNVSIEMLTHGNRQEVVQYVKKLMQEVKPGGGFILSSSHSIVPTVKAENAIAMWWAAKKFGNYSH